MSYNGTVRCSFCYQTGHNRRSCPELKKYCDENPDSDWAKFEKQRKAKVNKKRCGFCGEAGHNARTCPAKAALKTDWLSHNRVGTDLVERTLLEMGYGRGALVEFDKPEYKGGGLYHGVVVGFVPNNNELYNFFPEPKLKIYRTDTKEIAECWMPPVEPKQIKSFADKLEQQGIEKPNTNAQIHELAGWGYSATRLVTPSACALKPVDGQPPELHRQWTVAYIEKQTEKMLTVLEALKKHQEEK